jgi:hypothetical protein
MPASEFKRCLYLPLREASIRLAHRRLRVHPPTSAAFAGGLAPELSLLLEGDRLKALQAFVRTDAALG